MMLTPLHQLATLTYSPDLNVCHDGQAFVSWPAFITRILAQAAVLKDRSEQRWLLVNENPLEFAVLLFALLHANKQVVIPPNGLPGTLNQLADAYDAVATECLPTGAGDDSQVLAALDVDAISIMLYTSGSTGKPKAVPKRLKQLEAELDVLQGLWGATLGQSAVIATVPHHHIYGLLFRILWPLAARRVFDVVTCSHPDEIAERIAVLGNTVLISSPSQLTRLPEVADLTALKPLPDVIFSSGGVLPALASTKISQAVGHAPIEVLGSTETGGIAWRCQTDKDTWTALPGIQLQVDTVLQPSQPTLRSPFLFDETVLMDDLIEWLPDQTFRLCGRADKVVKVEQKRLSLTELEQLLGQHVFIAQVAAVVVITRRESVAVVAVLSTLGQEILLRDGRNALIRVLKQYLAPYYEAVLLPRYWRFVEAFPLNNVGKVTHAQLMALFDNVVMKSEVMPEIELQVEVQIKPAKKSSNRSAGKTKAERKHAAP